MNAVPFDTLKLARDLEAAGLAPPVAAGLAAALADAMISSDFATKADLTLLKTELLAAIDAKFAAQSANSETGFASLESKLELLRRDMTIKLGGMIFVAVGVLLAAMRLMPHS